MTRLSNPVETFTTPQRRAVAIATVIVAATRLLALARGPWDWDEMLFLLASRDYDVALHHPHPPGFPLFMLTARALVELGVEPFRALQMINLVAAMAIVPVMIFLGRELRLSFGTNLAAAILFSFLPNVWFFGGTGFSDVVSIVLAVAAVALLLRGSRSPGALVGGALVLAIAAGFRPQNLLVGLVPLLIAAWHQWRARRIWSIFAAAAVLSVVVVGSYAGAVAATGDWGRYRDSVIAHQRYLSEVDSFLSPIRPSLLRVADDFFVRPFRFSPVNVAMTVLAVAALVLGFVRRRTPVIIAAATFGPFWIVAWLTLDFHSASRFSIGYMPLLAILCSDAAMQAAAPARNEKLSRAIGALLVAILTGAMVVWAWPAVSIARQELSPPMQALAYIQEAAGRDTTIYVQKRMRPFSEYYLTNSKLVHLEDALPSAVSEPALYLREGVSGAPGGRTFSWPRGSLWNIARRRYFTVAVVPAGEGR
jgi:hypothetical protein